jgi:hypothetical protein
VIQGVLDLIRGVTRPPDFPTLPTPPNVPLLPTPPAGGTTPPAGGGDVPFDIGGDSSNPIYDIGDDLSDYLNEIYDY